MVRAPPPVAVLVGGLADHATVLADWSMRVEGGPARLQPRAIGVRGLTARSRTGEPFGLICRHAFYEGGSR
jgi:hypothetical protein